MFVEERQSAIMEELHANGKVKVKELSERFSVSEDLIRKDLSALEAKGLLKKAYGGAVLIRENIHRKIAAQRKDVNQEEKRSIAKVAVDQIQDGDVVFLDISTVNIRVARELVEREKQATIVTNMLEVVSILADSSLPVIFIGGEFDYGRDGFVGSLAMEQIMKFRFDISFLGVVGIDVHDNSVYTYMANDGATKRAILSSSKQAFMVCESDKFMQIGNYRYAGVDEFTGIITDENLDRENVKLMKNMQLNVQLAG